jgi:hypothetical protein
MAQGLIVKMTYKILKRTTHNIKEISFISVEQYAISLFLKK